MNYQSSADYMYIDVALKSLWKQFKELESEMSSFKTRPLSDYDVSRKNKFENLKKLNPTSSTESLAKLVDDEISFAASERVQFSDMFSNRFMTQYVTVAFLSHALCEAVINAILAIGLIEHGSKELFKVIEMADIKDKWRVGPKSFCPSYEFQTGTALFETLNHLTKKRNALVHYKVQVHVDGQEVLEGSKLERLSFKENTQWMWRFFSLPYDLAAHARTQLTGQSTSFILWDSSPIMTADAHKMQKLRGQV